MFKIDLKSKKSIYEQIIDGFKNEIISGSVLPDDKLPSVRELASQLTVNPNTIQKAYAELEKQGFIYSVAGRGNFVCEQTRSVDPKQVDDICDKIADLLKELKYLGVSERDIRYKVMALTGQDDREEIKTVQGSFERSESK